MTGPNGSNINHSYNIGSASNLPLYRRFSYWGGHMQGGGKNYYIDFHHHHHCDCNHNYDFGMPPMYTPPMPTRRQAFWAGFLGGLGSNFGARLGSFCANIVGYFTNKNA